MYCPNCGKEIPDGFKFCPYCRTKIISSNSSKEIDINEKDADNFNNLDKI